MKNYIHTISEDMYHRVYRLMKRDADPRLIAAALHLPLRTVLNVIARLKKNVTLGAENLTSAASAQRAVNASEFLDIYFLTKTRYALLQLVGYLIREQNAAIEQELQKVKSSTWKAVALQMSDVAVLDETVAHTLIVFYEEMKSRERYVAILDPSTAIDSAIAHYQIEGTIPIFGTERAFEEDAFAHKFFTASSSHSRNRHGAA